MKSWVRHCGQTDGQTDGQKHLKVLHFASRRLAPNVLRYSAVGRRRGDDGSAVDDSCPRASVISQCAARHDSAARSIISLITHTSRRLSGLFGCHITLCTTYKLHLHAVCSTETWRDAYYMRPSEICVTTLKQM